jgi:hypothetical protein
MISSLAIMERMNIISLLNDIYSPANRRAAKAVLAATPVPSIAEIDGLFAAKLGEAAWTLLREFHPGEYARRMAAHEAARETELSAERESARTEEARRLHARGAAWVAAKKMDGFQGFSVRDTGTDEITEWTMGYIVKGRFVPVARTGSWDLRAGNITESELLRLLQTLSSYEE